LSKWNPSIEKKKKEEALKLREEKYNDYSILLVETETMSCGEAVSSQLIPICVSPNLTIGVA